MVKSYLRHGPVAVHGLIASSTSNSLATSAGNRAIVPALEDVLVWDLKRGQLDEMWHPVGGTAAVTCISASGGKGKGDGRVAVGYADGSLRIWSAPAKKAAASSTSDETTSDGELLLTLNGHKGAVTALAWDEAGTRLASGGKDTNVVLWDIVAEAGIARLKGHRDQITQLQFIPVQPQDDDEASTSASSSQQQKKKAPEEQHLLSASKDTFLKLFSLSTLHCVATVLAHRSGAWSFSYSAEQRVLVSGGAEGSLKFWSVDLSRAGLPSSSLATEGAEAEAETAGKKVIAPLEGMKESPANQGFNITQVTWHPTLPGVLGLLTGDKAVSIFRLRTEDEVRKRRTRKAKRAREKGRDVEPEKDDDEVKWRDRLVLWTTVRAEAKIKSFDFAEGTAKGAAKKEELALSTSVFVALSNNSLASYLLPRPSSSSSSSVTPTLSYSLTAPGHRNDVRGLAVSSSDALLASVGNGEVKVWNLAKGKVVRTMACGWGLCVAFLPGDNHVVVGTKEGDLQLFDLRSSELLSSYPAHTGPLWSIALRPDSRGLTTCSADKDVKFWDFEVRKVSASDAAEEGEVKVVESKVLGLAHARTLKMEDDVLGVKYSPDGRLLAVALLDATVKVFYADTLKFFLSLYGHKLPVLSMDISYDSKMIITCSADKNIKIWGLEFGDCHRSLFAHEDSVMQVAFERASHLFWSVGKDKVVKYWDADKFECVQRLTGHHGEVWALAVSSKGKFAITAGHDRSIRVWEKTDEPLFIEEERERELEEIYDSTTAEALDRDALRVVGKVDGGVEAAEGADTTEVTKSTSETLMAGERIIEALELSEADQQATSAWLDEKKKLGPAGDKLARPSRSPVFQVYGDISPEAYVLKVTKAIPAASLHDALLVLPFSKVMLLVEHLAFWAKQEWEMSLTSRILFFLLRQHHSQIVGTRAMRNTMVTLRLNLRQALQNQKDTIGYNVAALRHIKRLHDANKVAEFYEAAFATGTMEDEQAVRAKIEAAGKKRRRQVMKS